MRGRNPSEHDRRAFSSECRPCETNHEGFEAVLVLASILVAPAYSAETNTIRASEAHSIALQGEVQPNDVATNAVGNVAKYDFSPADVANITSPYNPADQLYYGGLYA